ncbi:MAG: hypothetical protein IJX76_03185 [Clostridia bacterium]|nr:hypothetical protein [Clostridia bacterium]
MPKKSSRQKRREVEYQALRKRREHPDFIDGGRLNGYRWFSVFVGIWRVLCPLFLLTCFLLAEIVVVAIIGVFVLMLAPLVIYLIRVPFFEASLSCPHCEEPGEDRWYDWIFNTRRGNYKSGEGLRDIRPRRRYYRELKRATDTYTCPYCGKRIYILPREEYKKIRGNRRKNRD